MTNRCNLGMDCEEAGVCYAMAHGRPEGCGRPESPETSAETAEKDAACPDQPFDDDDYYGSPTHAVYGDEWLYHDCPGAW